MPVTPTSWETNIPLVLGSQNWGTVPPDPMLMVARVNLRYAGVCVCRDRFVSVACIFVRQTDRLYVVSWRAVFEIYKLSCKLGLLVIDYS